MSPIFSLTSIILSALLVLLAVETTDAQVNPGGELYNPKASSCYYRHEVCGYGDLTAHELKYTLMLTEEWNHLCNTDMLKRIRNECQVQTQTNVRLIGWDEEVSLLLPGDGSRRCIVNFYSLEQRIPDEDWAYDHSCWVNELKRIGPGLPLPPHCVSLSVFLYFA